MGTYRFLFSLTAKIGVKKLNSQIVELVFVLRICNLRGDKEGSSPAPTIATKLVENNISQMPISGNPIMIMIINEKDSGDIERVYLVFVVLGS